MPIYLPNFRGQPGWRFPNILPLSINIYRFKFLVSSLFLQLNQRCTEGRSLCLFCHCTYKTYLTDSCEQISAFPAEAGRQKCKQPVQSLPTETEVETEYWRNYGMKRRSMMRLGERARTPCDHLRLDCQLDLCLPPRRGIGGGVKARTL